MRVSASVCSYMAATVIFNLVVVSLMADTNVYGALQYGADLSDFCSRTLETRGWVALLVVVRRGFSGWTCGVYLYI